MGKKVGIVTLGGRFNYGNRLQNYAVMRVYEAMGCSPVSLELADCPNLIRSAKALAKRLLGRKIDNPEAMMSVERLKAFDYFNARIPTRHLQALPADLSDQYDVFSVGSDQVWNPYMVKYNEDWFFLKFARPGQRIALAPSIGLDDLDRKRERVIATGVQGFNKLSVREERGAELIKRASGRDAVVICDPTLTLTAEEWGAVSADGLTPKTPYVFAYLLGATNDETGALLARVTEDGDIPLVLLSDREKQGEPPAGPAEFISLISHAKHVVTDSYHAAVFASIMERPLTIVRRGGSVEMFSRLETLTHVLGIEEKVYSSSNFDISLAGDYEGTCERIKRERDRFMDYASHCLDIAQEA